MKQLLKRWHGHCHTHTHVILLFCLLIGTELSGQNVGSFEIPISTPAGLNPLFDQTTGMTRCTINWIGQIPTTVTSLYVNATISGTSVCLNSESAPSPTVIHPGFPVNQYQRNFTNTGVEIGHFLSSITLPDPKPYAAPPNTPFIILQFRAQPGIPYTINVSGYARVNNTNINIPSASRVSNSTGFSITGGIIKPDGINAFSCDDYFGLADYIPNVTVSKTANTITPCFPGVITESEFFPFGTYEFSQNIGTQGLYYTSYRIRPSKTDVTDVCCGISMTDYNEWPIGWLLGNDPITNAKFLAADFSGDGYVTGWDRVLIARCTLGIQTPPTEPNSGFAPGWLPWRFAPYATAPPANQYTNGTIPDYLDCFYDPLNGGLNLSSTSFWGVKRGDMDGSCESCGSSVVDHGTDDRNATTRSQTFHLIIPDIPLEAGQEVLIPVQTPLMEKIGDILVELNVHSEFLEVLSVSNGALSDEFASTGFILDQNSTVVKFSWLNIAPQGVNIDSNTVLFYIKAKAIVPVASLKGKIWLSANSINLVLGRGNKEQSKFDLSIGRHFAQEFMAYLKGANPSSSTSTPQLCITLPEAALISYTILSSNAIQSNRNSQLLPAGSSEITLDGIPQPPGIYSIILQTPYGQKALKLIRF